MKHRRTKATDIPRQVRMAVAIRDKGKCIICGRQGISNAHYIKRSQGRIGYRRKYCYIVPTMSLRRRFWKEL